MYRILATGPDTTAAGVDCKSSHWWISQRIRFLTSPDPVASDARVRRRPKRFVRRHAARHQLLAPKTILPGFNLVGQRLCLTNLRPSDLLPRRGPILRKRRAESHGGRILSFRYRQTWRPLIVICLIPSVILALSHPSHPSPAVCGRVPPSTQRHSSVTLLFPVDISPRPRKGSGSAKKTRD